MRFIRMAPLALIFAVSPAPAVAGEPAFATLYAFQGGNGGASPLAGLAAYGGRFYGSTSLGGGPAAGKGTVFEVSPARSGFAARVVHSFQGPPNDGLFPGATPLVDASGTIFGTTSEGGDATNCLGGGGCGTVFALAPSGNGYVESILYDLQGGDDGAYVSGNLVEDAAGNLFGTTSSGGGSANCTYGCGTVFELSPAGNGYAERVLHRFRGGSDGASPNSLVLGSDGATVYGTTAVGGAGACASRCGTLFALSPASGGYAYAVVHRFSGRRDGSAPSVWLLDANGELLGTTQSGGGDGCYAGTGCGTIFAFALKPGGDALETLYRFDGSDGYQAGALIAGSGGVVYGVTALGGGGAARLCEFGCGTVFALEPSKARGYALRVLHRFRWTDGAIPEGPLLASNGTLYGVTDSAGPGGFGTIFELRQ